MKAQASVDAWVEARDWVLSGGTQLYQPGPAGPGQGWGAPCLENSASRPGPSSTWRGKEVSPLLGEQSWAFNTFIKEGSAVLSSASCSQDVTPHPRGSHLLEHSC